MFCSIQQSFICFVYIITFFSFAFLAEIELNLPESRTIRGIEMVTDENVTYYGFFGLPYAQPPIGNLRFKSPVPIDHLHKYFDATVKTPRCTQISDGEIFGSEDCLYLNIHTANITSDQPVIVFLAGGVLDFNENVELFINKGVIFITINYRDGMFGYFCLDTKDVPGNAALRDIIAALKWIKTHISLFGGDPNNISLMGFGKNALAIDYVRLSPLGKGLFNKAMLLSSTSLCASDSTSDFSKSMSKVLVDIFRKKYKSEEDILDHLQSLTSTQLAVLDCEVRKLYNRIPDYETFSPVIENKFHGREQVISRTPIDNYRNCDFNDMPLIVGYTSKEFLLFYKQLTSDIITNDKEITKISLDQQTQMILNKNADILGKTADDLRQFYLRDGTNLTNFDVLEEAVDLYSDIKYAYPIQETLKFLGKCSKFPTYMYRFSYRGKLNDKRIDSFGIQGATHGDEMNYIFPSETIALGKYSRDYFVRCRLVTLFTNFAKNSNPVRECDSRMFNDIWIPIFNDTLHFLAIDSNTFISQNPDERRINFLRNLVGNIL